MDGNIRSNGRTSGLPAESAAPVETVIAEGLREVDEMIIVIAIVVVVVSAPLVGVVLVSLASRREDSAHSLAGRPSGALEAMARRLVGFHGDTAARRPGGRGPARARRRMSGSGLDGAGLLGAEPDVPHLVA
jgi:hypothetical protein